MKTILVTGGTGLVGYALQKIVNNDCNNKSKYKWIFLSSKDCNLKDLNSVYSIFEQYKPNILIHLAADVGGLFKNLNNNADMFFNNNLMNTYIMMACDKYSVKTVINCLSTCVFPDGIQLPMKEDNLHDGSPHNSNRGYAYAKRMLDIMSNCLSDKYPNNKYISIIPTNIYGPNDNFNLKDAHVLPAIIHKMYLAQKDEKDLSLRGTGKPLRQFIYSMDIGKIILKIIELLNNNDDNDNIIPSRIILSSHPNDEVTIGHVANCIKYHMKYKNEIIFDQESKSDGQYQKTASNDCLLNLFDDLVLTNLNEGIKETIEWFLSTYPNIRM